MLYKVEQSVFYREGTLVLHAGRKKRHLCRWELLAMVKEMTPITLTRCGKSEVYHLEGWHEDLEAIAAVARKRFKDWMSTHHKHR